MRGSIIIVSFFVVGLILGVNFDSLQIINEENWSSWVLYSLMFTVGIGIGSDKKILSTLKRQDIRVILLPVCTVLGSLIGAAVVLPFITGMSLNEAFAVASGFGYYSLSSIIINENLGAEIGTIGLMANIMREILTLLTAPLIVKYFSPIALVSSAGATSVDTLLPIITKFSGREFIVIAIFHGLVMELTVPLLVTLFSTL